MARQISGGRKRGSISSATITVILMEDNEMDFCLAPHLAVNSKYIKVLITKSKYLNVCMEKNLRARKNLLRHMLIIKEKMIKSNILKLALKLS